MADSSRQRNRQAVLIKRCPHCGGNAKAEARLHLSAHNQPAIFDLDRPLELSARLSLGQLLALVEVVPYKHFICTACNHDFRLSSQTGKDMALAMLTALQPVSRAPAKQTTTRHKPTQAPAAKTEKKPAPPSAPEWEPESLD